MSNAQVRAPVSVPAVTPDDFVDSERPIDEAKWERRMRCLTLRNAGMTFTAIADKLQISTLQVRRDIRIALRDVIREPAEDMIARQRSVLFDLQRQAYPAALQGDNESRNFIIKLLEHEARLFGLYAPARVAIGVSDTEFAEQAAELIASLGLQPPRELRRAAQPDTGTIDAEVVDDCPDDTDQRDGVDAEADARHAGGATRPPGWSNI